MSASTPEETQRILERTALLERAGRWQEALDLCREAFRVGVGRGDVAALAESVLRAGYCLRQMGELDAAAEHFELAAAVAGLHDDAMRLGRALNGLGGVYYAHGQFELAEQSFRRSREFAARAGDHLTSAFVGQNLGNLAQVRGRWEEALDQYRAALAWHRAIDNQRGVAAVLNNLALLHIGSERFAEAERCLDEALHIARVIEDVVVEGTLHVNRTELFVARGDLAAARASCDQAYEIVSRLQEHGCRSDVLRLYGIIDRESGRHYLAETHLREAVEVARDHGYPLEEAQAQRELALVLRAQERNRDALAAMNRAHELFTALQAERFRAEIAQRVDQLQDDFLELVQAWGESIEAKDRYTRGHCQRVADYACRLAERVGLSERDLVWFRMGALLHDVGKMETPEEILNKPGRLSDEEREIMERHTVDGDEMLAPIPFPWDIRPIVRSHHERWDGKGYPDRLAGDEIPLPARVLRFADVFDALTSARSYKPAMPADRALQIMRDDVGGFDPALFHLFDSLFPDFCRMLESDRPDEVAVIA